MLSWLLFVGVLASLARPVGAEEAADPYLWLEEVTSDKALAWVRQQNEQSTRELTASEAFRALDARLLKIMDSEEKIPFVEKAGPHYYNFWRDAQHPRGIWQILLSIGGFNIISGSRKRFPGNLDTVRTHIGD